MLAIGLWYPVYDRHLAWVGVRLETDASVSVAKDFFDEVSSDALAIEGFGSKLLFLDAGIFNESGQPLDFIFPPSRLVIVTGTPSCAIPRGSVTRPAMVP